MLDMDRVSRRFRRERRSAGCFLGNVKRYAPNVAPYVVTREEKRSNFLTYIAMFQFQGLIPPPVRSHGASISIVQLFDEQGLSERTMRRNSALSDC